MPLTTVAFVYATNTMHPIGSVPAVGWIMVVLAALVDLVALIGGAEAKRRAPDTKRARNRKG